MPDRHRYGRRYAMSPLPRWGHAWVYRSVQPDPRSDRRFFIKGLFLALTWFISGSNALAQTPIAQRIVVRSYNTIGIPLPVLDRAQSTLAELLREAGIDSSWRSC